MQVTWKPLNLTSSTKHPIKRTNESKKKSSKKRKKIWNKTSLRVFVPFVSHLFHSLSIETRNEEKKPNKIFKKLIKIVKQIQSDDEKYLWWKNSYNNNKRRENGVFLYIFILILTIWVNQNSEHINISVVISLFVFENTFPVYISASVCAIDGVWRDNWPILNTFS